ncbi:MAG TPA: aminoacyl-tRNA hydrolase [Acidimicrobiales bacterium]|nr:aminoacyl-tRNA hydrolase [Acidimicrobiales bacterium]
MALWRAREHDRRGAKSTLLIVGLANPGSEYEGSRHNVGGDALRLVATRRGAQLSLERRQRAMSVTVHTPRGPVTLAVPTTFMNESGAALAPLLRRTSIDDLSHLVVVHDELDLEPGRLQLKFGGGLAGHNGLRSIAQFLGTQDFARLRVGIGKPPSKEQGADYVLRRPSGKRREAHEVDVALAADAIETLLDYDFEEAQRRVNGS